MNTSPIQSEMNPEQKAALAAIESVGLQGLWANGKGGGFWVSGGYGYMSVEDCLKFRPDPEPQPAPEPEAPAFMLLSHMLGEKIAISRIVRLPGGSREIHVGIHVDGVFYPGRGDTLREALMHLCHNVDTFQPQLLPGQRLIDIRHPDPTQFVPVLNLWQSVCNEGLQVFHDHNTGLTERLVTVLPNGFLLLQNTFGVDPKPPKTQISAAALEAVQQSAQPAPASAPKRFLIRDVQPVTEPDVCGVCGGDPAECHPRQVDVDVFECDNSPSQRARRKGW